MSRVRIAVCEDNKATMDFIERISAEIIREYFPDYELFRFIRGEDFLEEQNKRPFDAVFLDIILQDTNGFEVAEKLCRRFPKTCIVFVSTESQLVYESFNYRPFGFICKTMVDTFPKLIEHNTRRICDYLADNRQICIDISENEHLYFLPPDIFYITTAKTNYISIVCSDKKYTVRMTMKELEELLPTKHFMRIHSRYIVNLQHYVSLDSILNEVELDNGAFIPISRASKPILTEYIKNYVDEYK